MARYNRKRASKSQLQELYENRLMSQPKIAQHLHVGERSVRRWMAMYGIKGTTKGKRNPNYHHGLTVGSYEYKKHRKLACERCDKQKNLGVHHLNLDHYDNNPKNLQTLCVSCHMSVHKQAYWNAIKAGVKPPKSNSRIGWTKTK